MATVSASRIGKTIDGPALFLCLFIIFIGEKCLIFSVKHIEWIPWPFLKLTAFSNVVCFLLAFRIHLEVFTQWLSITQRLSVDVNDQRVSADTSADNFL